MIRVAVVAPAVAVRTGLCALLSDGERVEVILEAPALADLLPLSPEIDVLVVAGGEIWPADWDQVLDPMNAPGVLLLVENQPAAPQDLDELPLRSWGMLPIDASAEALQAALQAVYEGLFVSTPAFMRLLLKGLPETGMQAHGSMVEALTDRESEVLQLLAQGLANKQIALALAISEHTVKFHVSAIYTKLGATNRTEAVRLGILNGLIVL